jgi:hypothetical protein
VRLDKHAKGTVLEVQRQLPLNVQLFASHGRDRRKTRFEKGDRLEIVDRDDIEQVYTVKKLTSSAAGSHGSGRSSLSSDGVAGRVSFVDAAIGVTPIDPGSPEGATKASKRSSLASSRQKSIFEEAAGGLLDTNESQDI